MRARVRKFAHVLERVGLAMAGAASGLFVAVLVGSNIAALTSELFLLVMMISGASVLSRNRYAPLASGGKIDARIF